MATNYDNGDDNGEDLYQSQADRTSDARSSAILRIGGLVAPQATGDRDPLDKAQEKRITDKSERDSRRNGGAVEGGVGSETSAPRAQAANAARRQPNSGVRSGIASDFARQGGS